MHMKTFFRTVFLSAACAVVVSCGQTQVKKDLVSKIADLDCAQIVDEAVSLCDNGQQKKAVEFLYAYMPVADIADYDPSLHVEGVKVACQAVKELGWNVPEREFRHFVLPLRVNNENLDDHRAKFYAELKDRVKGKSMYDAALEVNHWCHEKVTYAPSDARTSSPLASIRTALGRCGEESTFTVAALRSVGIPARQVYTPRWAHSDDNHAWVEVWIDGKWHYMGACEPSPVLDDGWFTSSALRALLMHTNVFGKYDGPEDVIQQNNCLTEINITSNYAPVARTVVTVVDSDNKPVEGAKLEYKIYNYAELYSAITTYTDAKGTSQALLGIGDIVAWATFGDKFGFAKVRGGENVTVALNHTLGEVFEADLDLVPPVEGKVATVATEEQAAANQKRLAEEDAIRKNYESTFYKGDSEYLVASRGNWKEIKRYMDSLTPEQYDAGMKMLSLVSAKDLRDTPSDILIDHIEGYIEAITIGPSAKNLVGIPAEIKEKYVLNPRIEGELLSTWRTDLKEVGRFVDPADVQMFVSHVALKDEYNPKKLRMTPKGVLKLMAADKNSRDIFFVAMCRANGIPARFEEITGKVQYYFNQEWHDVSFEKGASADRPAPQGLLTLSYEGDVDDPQYDTHFSVASLEKGEMHGLNFRTNDGLEGTMSYNSIFGHGPVALDCGYYMTTTGRRMASGRVLSHLTFFNVLPKNDNTARMVMVNDESDLAMIGTFGCEVEEAVLRRDPATGEFNPSTVLGCIGRGFAVMAFVKAGHEPSVHILHDFLGTEWQVPALIIFDSKEEFSKFDPTLFPNLPDKVTIALDNSNLRASMMKELNLEDELPIVLIVSSFGKIFSCNQGYTINLATRLQQMLVDKE